MKYEKGSRLRLILNIPSTSELPGFSNILEGNFVGQDKIRFFSKIISLSDVVFRNVNSEYALIPLIYVRDVMKAGGSKEIKIEKFPMPEYYIARNFFKASSNTLGFYLARFQSTYSHENWHLLINGNVMAIPSTRFFPAPYASITTSYLEFVASVERGDSIRKMKEKMQKLKDFVDDKLAKFAWLIFLGENLEEDTIEFVRKKFYCSWECNYEGTLKSYINSYLGTKYICGAILDVETKKFYYPSPPNFPKVLISIIEKVLKSTADSLKRRRDR